MEIADVKRQVVAAIDRARHHAAERRTRHDEAERAYATFLDRVAIPLMRQVANVLRAQAFSFTVFTPGGAVRLMSDKSSHDFIELTLDTSVEPPTVVLHATRSRGSRVIESERSIGAPGEIGEDDLLALIVKELEPFVER